MLTVRCVEREGKVLRRMSGAERETEEKCKMSSLMICEMKGDGRE
jgi:hypothetical protein